jgi:Dna[CI] antecedent, DciA
MRSAKTSSISRESVPSPLSLTRALAASDSLAGLSARLRESEQRLAVIAPLLPDGLAREVRPGPIDDEGWSVLVSNAAVAAKLRHLLPRLNEALVARTFRDLPIRVRVRAP